MHAADFRWPLFLRFSFAPVASFAVDKSFRDAAAPIIRKPQPDVYRGKTVLRSAPVSVENSDLASRLSRRHGLLNRFTAGDVLSASGFSMQLSISPYAAAQQTSKKKTVQRESAGDRSLLRASLSTWIGTHPSSPYPLAIGAVVLALLAGHPLGRTFGESILYIAIFPAIAFSAWYCGAGPSIVSMVVAVVGLRYWFGSPVDNFASVGNASVTIAFVIACTF